MKKVKIKELFDIRKGKKAEEVDRSDLRYIQIEDLRDNENIKFCSNSDSNVLCNQEDILIAWDGANAGTVGFGVEGVIGSTIARLRPKTDDFVSEYVGLLLQSKFNFFQRTATGATIPHVSRKALENLEIPLPTLSEQKYIVAKLNRAQRLIDIDREMLAKYDELIQSVFLEMFGDPVTNSKGLKEKEFGELVEITGGYAFKSKDFVDDESGVKVVKIANVHFIDLDWSEVQYLPIESLKEHEKYSLKEGDLLLALTRPIINSLDAVKAVVVKESDLPALLNQRVARIRVDSDEVTEDYITSFIYTQHFKRQVEKYASTSLQPNVSNKEVSKIKVLVPEIDQQRNFSQMRQLILNERHALEMNQKKSEELFSSLVQGVFG